MFAPEVFPDKFETKSYFYNILAYDRKAIMQK